MGNNKNVAMTKEQQLAAEIERLKAENQALKAKKMAARTISYKVSEKGAVSVYGMGRFPVTLYKEQWEVLISHIDGLKAFMAAHESELAVKGSEEKAS